MFTVIGEALLDMVQPEPEGAFTAIPGGGPLNIAVGLQRLGHPTEMMARFSSGSLGAIVHRHAERNGLGLAASVSTDDPATLAFASLDETGKASYDFYVDGTADWGWTADELAALPSTTRALHTGSVAASILPGAGVLVDWWGDLRAAGEVALSYDPNVRPALVGSRVEAVRRVERFVSASHVVKSSDEDLEWLYPDRSPLESLGAWAQLGPLLVVLTRGVDGCTALRPDGDPVEVDGVRVEVVDTIGAGDSFESGLLSALADAEVLTPQRLDSLSAEVVADSLRRAVDVSAMTCQRAGADPPTREEYDASRSAAHEQKHRSNTDRRG